MGTIGDKVNNTGTENLSRQFQTECLSETAYVEIHKSHGKVVGFVFHVGEFSLPLLRSRPYQRICDRVDSNLLRPWVMGRVTYRSKVLLENPGRPGIVLKGTHGNLADIRHYGNDDLLSAAIWINGNRFDLSQLFPEQQQGYFYKEIAVTTTPVLEQILRIEDLNIVMEMILSSDGPIQRTTVEAGEEISVELGYYFLSMFPRGVVEFYGNSFHGGAVERSFGQLSQTRPIVDDVVPQAKWLAAYSPDRQFGTLIYSPQFEQQMLDHLLVRDCRQGFKVYHVVGDCEHFPQLQVNAQSARLTVSRSHPQQLILVARPIEADPSRWKQTAEEKALLLMGMTS